jgi:hypothetical protein
MGTSLDCVLHLALSFFHRGAGISGKAKHRIGSNLVIWHCADMSAPDNILTVSVMRAHRFHRAACASFRGQNMAAFRGGCGVLTWVVCKPAVQTFSYVERNKHRIRNPTQNRSFS